MSGAAIPSAGAEPTMLRHRPTTTRLIADKIVVARPTDGTPIVLAPTAAFVWQALDVWTTRERVEAALADLYPVVEEVERATVLSQILSALADDGLLEHV
jgi:hypothetical protein